MECWSVGVGGEQPQHALRRYTGLVRERPRNRLLFSQYPGTPLLLIENSEAEPSASDLALRTRFSMFE